MRLPSIIREQLPLAAIGTILILSVSGCGMVASHRHRHRNQVACEEVMGVDDPVFHGYKKTCWRTWDNPAWAAQPCPTYCPPSNVISESTVPAVPMNLESPVESAPTDEAYSE